MSERMDGWRECADPVELAAAVAAGVEVQRNWGYDWQPGTNNETAEQFAGCTKANCRYRLPVSWSWSPEPPADVPTGAERYLAERLADPEYRAAYEAAAPVTGDDLRERIARAIYADDVENERTDFREGVAPCYYDNADAVLAVLPAPPIDEGAGPSGPPWYLAQDVWMALGGDSNAFSAWAHCEDDRRTWGDAWAQIIAAVGGSRMEGDTNPPPGTILDLPSYQWVRESPTPPPVPPWPDGVLRDAANRLRWIANSGYIEDPGIKRIIRSWADELDATPAPPWPGAVLSGLVDEDGVPTWLAQAGQVRGEQVRRRSDFMWVNNDQMVAHLDTVWVEVRAPRAVPEPETERVPWWEARDRLGLAGDPFVEVGSDDEGPWVRVVEGGTKLHSPVDPDGTVKVLRRDGDQ